MEQQPTDTLKDFIQSHFPGLEKETWYPAIYAIAEGYAKHLKLELYSLKKLLEIESQAADDYRDAGIEIERKAKELAKALEKIVDYNQTWTNDPGVKTKRIAQQALQSYNQYTQTK